MDSSDAIRRLVEGFRRFRAAARHEDRETFTQLAKGQSPRVMVIACSDSRVDPAIILSAEPGELFVVRNVANLVPPYQPDQAYHGTSAALEFAVRGLEVGDLVVLGHAQCGGIEALVRGADEPAETDGPGEFIAPWVRIAERARERVAAAAGDGAAPAAAYEQAAIGVSLENLMTFPWVETRVRDRRLRLHGWYFDIEGASLRARDPDTGRFEPLA